MPRSLSPGLPPLSPRLGLRLRGRRRAAEKECVQQQCSAIPCTGEVHRVIANNNKEPEYQNELDDCLHGSLRQVLPALLDAASTRAPSEDSRSSHCIRGMIEDETLTQQRQSLEATWDEFACGLELSAEDAEPSIPQVRSSQAGRLKEECIADKSSESGLAKAPIRVCL